MLGLLFQSWFQSFAHVINMSIYLISHDIVFANPHCCKKNRYYIKHKYFIFTKTTKCNALL